MIPALAIGMLITATGINSIAAEGAVPGTTQSLSIQHDKLSKSRFGLIRSADGDLTLNGKPYRGIGANYFNAFYRSLDGDDSYKQGFDYLKSKNIPFVRFMCGAYWPVNWELYRTDKKAYFAKLDAFVKTAEEKNMGLIPSLFWQINTFPDMVGEPRNQWGNPKSKTREFMRNYTREIVERYKDSPALWAWEFGNEMNLEIDLGPAHLPQVAPQYGTPAARTTSDTLSAADMESAYKEFAEVIRKLDPQRIIISGNANNRPAAWHLTHKGSWEKDSENEYKNALIAANPAPMDTISTHVYPEQEGDFAPATMADYRGLIQVSMAAAKESGKVLFVGEFGTPLTHGNDNGKENFQRMIDALTEENVPLAAVWVFDYPPQTADYNIPSDSARAYQLEIIGKKNPPVQP